MPQLASWPKGTLLVLVSVAAACCWQPASCFLSPTSERTYGHVPSRALCLDFDRELLQHLAPFNFTLHSRSPLGELKGTKLEAELRRMYSWQGLLSERQLAEGRSNMGDMRRLERVVSKLLLGKPITVAGVGGSVTTGIGAQMPRSGWVYRFFDWVETTFPAQGHQLVNTAVPATTSSYISPCINSLVPANVDLVLVEFSFNDGEMSGWTQIFDAPVRLGLERLLRKLLRLPGEPAVVYYHYWPPAWGTYSSSYWAGIEDLHEAIVRYYGVPSLSLRQALHAQLRQTPQLHTQYWWSPNISNDQLHPNCVGHKLIADQVVALVQDTAASLLQARAFQQVLAPQAAGQGQAEGLRPPIYPNNTAEAVEFCLAQDAFKQWVFHTEGWRWEEDFYSPNKPHWGYKSTTVGDILKLNVPLDSTQAAVQFAAGKLVLAVAAQVYTERMGHIKLSCEGGCTCDAVEYNLLHPFYRANATYWKSLRVQLKSAPPGEMQCTVAVLNSPKTATKDGSHEVKVSGLMVSAELDFIDTWKYDCEKCS